MTDFQRLSSGGVYPFRNEFSVGELQQRLFHVEVEQNTGNRCQESCNEEEEICIQYIVPE